MKQFLYSIVATLFLLPAGVWAQGNLGDATANLGKAAQKAGTNEGDLTNIVGTAINAMLTFVGLIFFVLMVYGGILWMTARGEEDQVKKAQKVITQAMIGVIVTVSAYAVTVFWTTRFS